MEKKALATAIILKTQLKITKKNEAPLVRGLAAVASG